MKIPSLFFMLVFSSVMIHAQTQEQKAHYFRAWQGFSKNTPEQMVEVLPSFMTATVDLYEKHNVLSNYIVIIPPRNSPDYIPHELALVAINEEADYRRIRETSEGKAYSDAHWDVFNRSNSRSAAMLLFSDLKSENTLKSNTAYNLINQPTDWSTGVNHVFVATRKSGVTPDAYLNRLKIRLGILYSGAEKFGLKGCIVIANENYEIIYTNWQSQKVYDKTILRSQWKKLQSSAEKDVQTLMSQLTKPYVKNQPVFFDQSYHGR